MNLSILMPCINNLYLFIAVTQSHWLFFVCITHWGRVTHICISKLTIIASDNGLSPGRRQAIIWTSVGILLIGPLGTNFSEILIEIITFSFQKMRLKVSSVKWRPCCLGLNVIIMTTHGSFCECTQQMRDNVTMLCCVSLAGPIHKMIPGYPFNISYL